MSVGFAVHVGEGVSDQNDDRARLGIGPIGSRQLAAACMTPTHVFVLAIRLSRALQKRFAPQAERTPSERNERAHEVGEFGVFSGAPPIDPTDFIVLAIGIVVALLRAAEFVA